MLVSWNTTRDCNLYCQHCYRDSGPEVDTSGELDLKEGKKLLSEMKKAGFRLIIFSGGEPLLRDDIFKLTGEAKRLGMRPVLGTNGMLIDQTTAKKIKESGIAGIAISLDSPEAEYHNQFRGQNEAFQQAIRGLKLARHQDLRVQINMTLTKNNVHYFPEMIDFAQKLGVQALHPFFLVPTGRGQEIEGDSLKEEKYFQMINQALQAHQEYELEIKPTCAPQFIPLAKKQGQKLRFQQGCLAGKSYCCILPNGDVHICPYLPVKVGNVREESFADIWQNSTILNRLRTESEYEGRCGNCSQLDICGGCRARAYYYSQGNYMAADPWCFKSGGKQDG